MKSSHTPLKQKILESKAVLASEFGIKNTMAVPYINRVVVNSGTGERLRNKDSKEKLVNDFAAITGQKPKVQAAHISVAGFGIRAGMPVGLTSTLRRDRMYNFLDKVISVVLPRLRDFRGLPTKSFDKSGNYTFGISEHTVFPEIDLAKVDKPQGLEITLVIKKSSPEKSRKLLELIGIPFEKND